MKLDHSLVDWIESVMGGHVVSAQRTFGGGSRFTWLVDLDRAAEGGFETVPLVLRVESGQGAFHGTPVTLQREAEVYAALQESPARVPTLYGVAGEGTAMLMSRAPGTAEFHRLSDTDAAGALDDFVDVLAALHSLPVDSLHLPGLRIPSSVREHATNEVDAWQGLADRCAVLDAEIEYALAWLRANPPEKVARTSIVQGDTGPGNFVVDGARVSAVIDWEFAHIGDPVDDIAWFVYRASGRAALANVGDVDSLLQRYERAAGYTIDQRSLAYYRVFVQVRCAITTALTISRGGGAMGLAGYRVAHRRFVREAMQSIADALGVVVPRPEMPPVTPSARTTTFDEALREIDALAATLHGEQRLHARAAGTTMRHLRTDDMVGAALAAATAEEMIDTFATTDENEIRVIASSGGAAGDIAMLRCLARRSIRHEWLWSAAIEPTGGQR